MKKFYKLIKNYNLWTLTKAVFLELERKLWREMVRNSYAQNYEDIEIEKIFGKKYRGRYLEIGAYQPKRLSNTYRFYKNGWQGIVVEPNPEVEKRFLKIRERDKFINKGVGEKKGKLKYYQFLIPALNTFSKKAATENIKKGHKLEKIIEIEVWGIKEIVRGKIDFLSIDTEGMDYKILNKWPWKKIKPRVICLEKDEEKKSEKLLLDNGYRKYFENEVNIIFEQKLTPVGGRKQ